MSSLRYACRAFGITLLAALAFWLLKGSPQPRPAGARVKAGVPAVQTSAVRREAMDRFMHAALPFEANLGQTDPAVKFVSRGVRYTAFFTDRSVVLRLAAPRIKDRDNVLEMKFVGARSGEVAGLEPLASRSRYYHGRSANGWQGDVPHYGKVSYTGTYRDTQMIFYGRQGELEYDVVLGPQADPKDVVMQFSGTSGVRVNRDGDLVLALRDGPEILQRRPKIYQQWGNEKKEIRGGYRVLASNRVQFEVGGYDRGKPLVIDPVLTYSSYLGGSSGGNDFANGIALDASGNAYVAGYTNSVAFPAGTIPPFQATRAGGNDAFVAKLSADASTLVYSTYLGGTGDDQANGIAVDGAGNAYVVGQTSSADFPTTPGAYAKTPPGGGQYVFAAKLSATGAILYSTYVGSGTGAGIAVDTNGRAYITGTAYCCSYPTTTGAYQRTGAGYDAFITKVNATGTGLEWSTLLGGNADEYGYGIALDASNNVYLTGYTYSTNFPVTNGAFQTTQSGYYDAFVTKMNSSGTALVYSTLLGGSNYDYGYGIAVDAAGYAYVTGQTTSANFPVTMGAYQTAMGSYGDAFVAKVNQTGTGLIYSTHVGTYNPTGKSIAVDTSGNAFVGVTGGTVTVTAGAYNNSSCCSYIVKMNASGSATTYVAALGSSNSYGMGIALDVSGNAYLAGAAYSGFPTTPGVFQPVAAGSSDALITKLSADGTSLVYSTYLGGGGGDQGLAVALDSSGNAYITGSAGSIDFPVTIEAAKSPYGPYTQAFVTKFNASGTGLAYSTFVGGSGNDTGRAIAVDAAGVVYVAGQTNSTDFPVTAGVLQTANAGSYDAFVFKLSAVGRLLYSTLLGGSGPDDARGVAVDAGGNVFVAGNTGSPNFATTATLGNPNTGGQNVFVTKLNAAASSYLYSTIVGGSYSQYVSGLAIDAAGSAYITGYTYSPTYPVTPGAFQTSGLDSPTAFVTKLAPSGSALSYSTYLGGYSGSSFGNAIAVDAAGSAYVTGYTSSSTFPVTAGAVQPDLGGNSNAFVTKLNPTGSGLSYSTYLGGSSSDQGNGIAVDANGNAYVAGNAGSSNFPTVDGATIMETTYPTYGSSFALSLNPFGTALLYSTYLGGSYYSTTATGIAIQPGYAVVTGTTTSTGLLGASMGFQKNLSGVQNAFVTKISDPPPGCSYSVSPTSYSFGTDGGSGTVIVTAPAGCPWIAVSPQGSRAQLASNAGSVSGSGNGLVPFTVAADNYTYSSGGVGSLTVAGRVVTFTQSAPCSINLPSTAVTIAPGGGSSAVNFNVGSCSWPTFTPTPWISIQSSYTTNGLATLTYKVLPNRQNASRTGVIYIGSQALTLTQLAAQTTTATILSPSPGTTLSGSAITFFWTAISGADQYKLEVGTVAGGANICSLVTSNTSAVCSGIPVNGSTVYAQLSTHYGGAWGAPLAITYTAGSPSLGQLISPGPVTAYPTAATTALQGTQATFNWSPGLGADQYQFAVGSTVGASDICSNLTTGTSSLCTNIPCDGRNIYAQLSTHNAGGWQAPTVYTYLACTAAAAAMTDPTAGTTLSGSKVTFKWTSGMGADQYWLDVGTSLGSGNICALATTTTQYTCQNIPTDGRTIYVQLYTHFNGAWHLIRYTYTAATISLFAQLTSPVPGSVLTGSSVTFQWTPIASATAYWLDVGTGLGLGDICAIQLTAGTTQYTCNNIPVDGRPIYVQLYTQIVTWANLYRYTFNAFRNTAGMVTPVPGSNIGMTTQFCWAPPTTLPADYWMDVGTTAGGSDIWRGAVTATCQLVPQIPAGLFSVYVTLYTRKPATTGSWTYPGNSYVYNTYNAFTPRPNSKLTSSARFCWTPPNTGQPADYWLDVGTTVGNGDVWRGVVTDTCQTVNNIPMGLANVYVQLYMRIPASSGAWLTPVRFTYNTLP